MKKGSCVFVALCLSFLLFMEPSCFAQRSYSDIERTRREAQEQERKRIEEKRKHEREMMERQHQMDMELTRQGANPDDIRRMRSQEAQMREQEEQMRKQKREMQRLQAEMEAMKARQRQQQWW